MSSFLPPAGRSMMDGFLTAIVAVLVFISGLALTATGSIGALVQTWNTSVTGTLTVQVSGPAAAQQSKAVLAALTTLPEVRRAGLVADENMRAMLKPWLGDETLIAGLPLPVLIDVELADRSPQAVERVSGAVKGAAAEAVVDDHRVWLNRIADFAQGLSYVAASLMALCFTALVLTVIFATRASLTEYMHVIEVLHLVGARDRAIAAQFSWRAVRQTLWGGLLGLLVFAPAVAILAWLAGRIDAGLLAPVTLPVAYWIGLAALPVIAAIIAFLSAMTTVRRALGGMV